jgi:RNA polymerase sigma-70 factor
MAHESIFSSRQLFLTEYAHLCEALAGEANCARWGLSREDFAEVLRRSAEKRFRGMSTILPDVVETYLRSLHLEDLALACACSAGIESAWEFFMAEFRSELRSGARAILRASGSQDAARAEELADSLYAELYGVRSAGGEHRKSLFEYFHGRSKLSTWLRAVLAQRHVDLLRTGGKTVSLDTGPQGEAAREPAQRTDGPAGDPNREMYLRRVDGALSAALAALTSRERMILACYYVDQLTQAQIGRMLREHESTVSRQIDRIRWVLREDVTQRLLLGTPAQDGRAAEPALDQPQVDLAFEYALEDWSFDLSRALSKQQAAADPPKK